MTARSSTIQHDPSRLPDPAVTPTLSVMEAGALLGIGRTAAYQAAQAGDIPTIRLGRSRRVPTAALLRLLKINTDA